jgi:hypothetical protein
MEPQPVARIMIDLFSGVTSEIAESSMFTGLVTPITFRAPGVGANSAQTPPRTAFHCNLQAVLACHSVHQRGLAVQPFQFFRFSAFQFFLSVHPCLPRRSSLSEGGSIRG